MVVKRISLAYCVSAPVILSVVNEVVTTTAIRPSANFLVIFVKLNFLFYFLFAPPRDRHLIYMIHAS